MKNAVARSLAMAALMLVAALSSIQPAAAQSLYVADVGSAQVVRYDTQTKASEGAFTSGYAFTTPLGLAFGSDGNLYVADIDNSEIVRFDGKSGAYQKTVVPFAVSDGFTVGPNGTLYDTENYSINNALPEGHVLAYDKDTGARVSDFPGGAGSEFGDLKFGPDGSLYVADDKQNRITRFDGKTGASLGAFTLGGDLLDPYAFTFGPDGNLYVGDRAENEIDRFNGTTGVFMDVFASGGGLNFPGSLAFGPDGSLYVASFGANEIERFNSTGAFRDVFASGVAGALAFAPAATVPEPSSLAILLTGGLTLSGALLARRRVRHPRRKPPRAQSARSA